MRRLSRDEDGATAVIVAISLGVLVAVLALVADAGAIYVERRELQNGADAAALAIAEDCARGLTTCGSPAALAAAFADENASDDASNATIVAFDPSGSVTVETTTDDGAGGTLVKFAFAPIFALFGGAGEDGRTVDASATATWGTPGQLRSFPITVSACEYDEATASGTAFATQPISTSETPTILDLHGSGPSACPSTSSGHDVNADGEPLPAGFGWLNQSGCEVVTTAIGDSDWIVKDGGANPECRDDELTARLGTIVHLPVFGDFCRKSGPTASAPCTTHGEDMYEVLTYAAFYLTGFQFPGESGAAPGWSTPSCSGGGCLAGFFVTDVVTGGPTGGSTPGGLVSISLVS